MLLVVETGQKIALCQTASEPSVAILLSLFGTKQQLDHGSMSLNRYQGIFGLVLNESSSDKCFQGAFNFGPDTASNRTVAELVTELITHTGGQWIDASDSNDLHEASKLNLATDKAFHLLKWQSVWDFKNHRGHGSLVS